MSFGRSRARLLGEDQVKVTFADVAGVDEAKDEVKELLKEEIVSRYYYQKGRLEASLSFDQEVKKALEVFNKSETYKGLLDGTIVLNKEK